MKLSPLSDDGDEIVFPKFLKKCKIGRAEIKKAFHGESKEKAEKVSKSAVDFQIQNEKVTVTNIGKNSIYTGAFGMPLEKLGPDDERILNFGDVIAFRQDALVFRVEDGSNRNGEKSKVFENENTEEQSEESEDTGESIKGESQTIESDNAEWTSGSISDHQKFAPLSKLSINSFK